jgi:hypothetical protein
MKVIIAGSRRLPRGQAPRLLIRFLAALPDDAVILMRRPRGDGSIAGSMPGPFEMDALNLCGILHLEVEWFSPEPTDKHPGRASVFLRDIDMMEKADLAILFVHEDEVETGYSGTMHLMDKALDAGRPCYAYAVSKTGKVSRVGEYDPQNLYLDIAPSA